MTSGNLKKFDSWGRLIVVILFLLLSCGEKGGDHVGDDKTFDIDSELPTSALQSSSISPLEANQKELDKYLFFYNRYEVCTADDYIEKLSLFLKRKKVDINKGGLEPALSYIFSNIEKFSNQGEKFSERITFSVHNGSQVSCDLLILLVDTEDFPFTESEFKDKNLVLLNIGQVQDLSGDSNGIPILYIKNSLSSIETLFLQQLGIASYIGLYESTDKESFLNPDLSNLDEKTWNFPKSFSNSYESNDTLSFIYFTLLYFGVINPENLERAHYFEDLYENSENSTVEDSLSVDQSKGVNLSFYQKVGDPYIRGVREIQSSLNICINQSELPSAYELAEQRLVDFIDWNLDQSLAERISIYNEQIQLSAQLANETCNLYVIFRSNEQFPFNDYQLNGVYFHEGTLKSDGQMNRVPFIYLNYENLSLNGKGSQKDAQLVMKHEFAHYLGFKHSRSTDSILYPAGYNVIWDFTGYDSEMVEAWSQFYSQSIP